MMAELVLDGGESERVTDLADEMIASQQDEIETMEEWQQAWDC